MTSLRRGRLSQRLVAGFLLGGQVVMFLLAGKINRRNTLEQMAVVGIDSLPVTLISAVSVGMFTIIQVGRELAILNEGETLGGVLALTLTRELAPMFTGVVLAGRDGAAFTAELGTMQITQQIEALYMLRTNPIDYLVVPRVVACGLMLPVVCILFLITGMIGGGIMAANLYHVSPTEFFESARKVLTGWDICCAMIKSVCFGILIAVISCNWGLTTTGGTKGIGQSTTGAVVAAMLAIFVSNFFLSWLLFSDSNSVMLKEF
ncbi:MAG: MlaE family lipid ABC transporter permease subunit [Chroococcidiopsidaceae cyanobacterium CP_BM_ER_R8_30]|nr:MlaE family lipid ABC transporter permease subunit [Chroococcidiopsidaceae cyanobacterium CP_BM_ER_R8_30]